MSHASKPRIAVVGGGPGGLTLARVLQTRGLTATVFELDDSATSRQQGGTLDMQTETGQVALKAAGLDERFFAIARFEGQDGRLLDKSGTVLLDRKAGPEERAQPEIDRGDLRRLLLDSLAPGVVRWGSKVDAVRPVGDGTHEVTVNGISEVFDLVVGADGAWSRVRPLVSPAQPAYSGVTFVEVGFEDAERHHPEISRLVGNGSMFALSDNRGLIAQRNADDHIRVYVAFRVAEGWLVDPADARATLLAMFADWAPELRALLTDCGDSFVVRPLYALPVPHVWQTRAGVTLLGDAAHLMSPFSGLGANLAMLDGADLANAIADAPDLETAVRDYESVMLPRGREAAVGAAKGLDSAIAADAPRGALAALGAHA
jgi:2-polyprenyl-6-methoxyphenol hydroxylase-like FAD-dependent oxidoreductase